ncbi:MAG: carboxypeptidase-like regulatory domain-containing protein [Planctomycetota bacterium]
MAKLGWPIALSIVLVAGVGWWLWPTPGPADLEGEAAAVEGAQPRASTAPAAIATADEVPASIPAPAGASVSGIVLGPEGDPTASVRVALERVLAPWPEQRTTELEQAVTGADGRFAFRTERGADLRVTAGGVGLARTEVAVSPRAAEIVVQMEHGFTLGGVVVGPRGSMPDCEVVLEPVVLSAERAVGTRTDRSGRFFFRNIRAGAARLTARHPDYRPASETVNVGTIIVSRLRFSTDRALSVVGNVADDTGQSVEGATVRGYPGAWNSGLFVPVTAVTDARGEFVLRGLGPGTLRLEVRHARYSTHERLVSVRGENPPQVIELLPRSRVRGRLVGDVPAGTMLRLRPAGEAAQQGEVAPGGEFVFRRELAGRATLELLDDQLCFHDSWSRTLAVEVGEVPLELKVTKAAVVRGQVRDRRGEPLPHVRVLRREQTGSFAPPELVAVTDGQGRFEVRGLPRAIIAAGPLGRTRLVVSGHGYAVQEITFSPPAPGETLDLDPVVLAPPGTIEGRVTRRRKGMAGAVVFTGNVASSLERAVTGPNGRFFLRDLPPGSYRLKVAFANMPLWLSDEVYTVRAGEAVEDIEVRLPAGRKVHARIVAPDKTPIANALVVVRGIRGAGYYADANGELVCEVPDEDVELQVFGKVELHELRVSTTERVARDRSYVEVTLPMVPWGTVIGRVLGLPGRKPVASGILRIESLDAASGDEVRDRQRNVRSRWVEIAGGSLRLEYFPAGRSRLTLQAEGYVPHTRDIDLSANDRLDLGEILLERGARVRGMVVDAEGTPIGGARVYLGDELDSGVLGRNATGVFTDAAGRFELWGVSAQSATVVVAADSYAVTSRRLELPADLLRPEPLRIVPSVGATIAVKVEGDSAGQGEMHAVFLKRDGEIVDSGNTDEGGLVQFFHKNPGTYEIEVLGHTSTRSIELSEAEETYGLVVEVAASTAQ